MKIFIKSLKHLKNITTLLVNVFYEFQKYLSLGDQMKHFD